MPCQKFETGLNLTLPKVGAVNQHLLELKKWAKSFASKQVPWESLTVLKDVWQVRIKNGHFKLFSPVLILEKKDLGA